MLGTVTGHRPVATAFIKLLQALCLRAEGGPAPTICVDDEVGDSLSSGCFDL